MCKLLINAKKSLEMSGANTRRRRRHLCSFRFLSITLPKIYLLAHPARALKITLKKTVVICYDD